MNLLLRYLAALAVKHLSQALLRDKPRVIHIKMMKCKHEILHCQSLFLVDGRCQKLTIVDGARVVEVYGLKDILKIVRRDIRILECLLHLIQVQETRIGLVQGAECFPKRFEVYHVLS